MAKKEKKAEGGANEAKEPETDTKEPETCGESECTDIEDEGNKVEQELKELQNQYLRLMAEFDNFRKRTAKERETLFSMAKADTVESFLPVFDNLERAVNQPTEDEAYKKGVEMIAQQFSDSLKKLGVSEIEAAGVAFDPEKHNAVMHVEDDTLGENIVAEVFQKGFEIDGKVIRHAVVKVAN